MQAERLLQLAAGLCLDARDILDEGETAEEAVREIANTAGTDNLQLMQPALLLAQGILFELRFSAEAMNATLESIEDQQALLEDANQVLLDYSGDVARI